MEWKGWKDWDRVKDRYLEEPLGTWADGNVPAGIFWGSGCVKSEPPEAWIESPTFCPTSTVLYR